MKSLSFMLCIGFLGLITLEVNAADYTVSSTSNVPTGYSQSNAVSGWYTKDGSSDRYRLSSSNSSSNGSSSYSTSSASSGPDTTDSSNILGLGNSDLRTGNVDMNTIPNVIVSVITFLLAIAGTISVLALIYHAVKMQLASGITGDSSGVDKAKSGMKGALIGFVISILAWFLVTRFVEILSSIS